MTLPEARELDCIHRLRRRISHERWRYVMTGERGPMTLTVSSEDAKIIANNIARGNLFADPMNSSFPGFVACLDGVSILEEQ